MKRIVAALGLLALAGCEQTKPPTPEGLKLIALRTAKGTKSTKLETKIQPDPPLAGQTSIWNFKVFDVKDLPGGTRKEWKFFNALPQSSGELSTNQVEMNAWLISKDAKVFLPQKPRYGQYGSFMTDWVIPQAGAYTLFVQYQPVVAKDEMSGDDLKGSKILPIESAHWDVSVGGTAKALPLTASGSSRAGQLMTVYSLSPEDYGTRAPFQVAFATPNSKVNEKTPISFEVRGATRELSEISLTALAPDSQVLLHAVGSSPAITPTQRGQWRAWFSFSLDGKPYAAPLSFGVS